MNHIIFYSVIAAEFILFALFEIVVLNTELFEKLSSIVFNIFCYFFKQQKQLSVNAPLNRLSVFLSKEENKKSHNKRESGLEKNSGFLRSYTLHLLELRYGHSQLEV